ncbi:hypothetical protein FKG94_15425 [Exilibacterium tricleocarpae]|uniref:histidine kinase n=1 Tax=Exilibacterium tricleocarpae TaxID=2591008 RepID=A0A545TFJ1_9GAMM|nr:ATP-binding protein [Exilibacterium tricleocarpae]TQV75999.1 hypothetical protein FKG94_15425 [Exilibacterium tricleocarpae]
MARLFIQLYLLIVATLLVMGWGLDRLWQLYGDQTSLENDGTYSTLLILEHELRQLSPDRWQAYVDEVSASTAVQLLLFDGDDIAGSAVQDKLARGEMAQMQSEADYWLYLKQIPGADRVLALKQQREAQGRSPFEWLLMLIFYAAIALVIMIWVWPLSRDLKILERATRKFADNSWTFDADIKPNAQVFPLANAFRQMAARIERLINSHKDMSNAVSHELKTPLARIQFELAIAEKAADLTAMRRHISNIKGDAEEMNALATATLDYAILERADFSLHISEHRLAEILAAIVEHTNREAGDGVHIRFHTVVPAMPVSCDLHLMERLAKNLIYNALKYARTQVSVSLGFGGQAFCLTVEDDGPGIPESERERVFDSFVRLRTAGSGKDGFGLGLAIVKRVAQWHDGSVRVSESDLGGARFDVWWPRSPGVPAGH